MAESIVETVLVVLGAYAVAGFLLLVPFHRMLLPKLDETANGASWGFHVLVSPGLVALWPVMLAKWMRLRAGRNAHGSPDAPVSSMNIRRAQSFLITVLAIALPLLLAAAIAARPAPPPTTDLPVLGEVQE